MNLPKKIKKYIYKALLPNLMDSENIEVKMVRYVDDVCYGEQFCVTKESCNCCWIKSSCEASFKSAKKKEQMERSGKKPKQREKTYKKTENHRDFY
jgi:hypothetical protein